MSERKRYQIDSTQDLFKVTIDKDLHYTPVPEELSNPIFEKLQKEKPIFNGTMMCVKEFGPQGLKTYSISFKEFLASRTLKEPYHYIHKPLGVSGWILHRDKVLIGIRSENVLTYTNYYELVPSGGVDERAIEGNSLNFKKSLFCEFIEETGMDRNYIESITPKLLIYCMEELLFDICQEIKLFDHVDVDCETGNEEYKQLFWVPKADLKEFLEDHRENLVPTSLAIIEENLLP